MTALRALLLRGLAGAGLVAAAWPAGAGGESAALVAALDTVQETKLRSDLAFVASDEMRGRDTPSPEQRIVARFLRARLERFGWKPGARDGYLFTYPLTQNALDPAATRLVASRAERSVELAFAREWWLTTTWGLAERTRRGGVVFCGSGSAEDLAGVDLAGRWVLVLDDGAERRRRDDPLRESGALGVLRAPAAGYAGEPYAERYRGTTERLIAGRVEYGGASAPEHEGQAGGRESARRERMQAAARAAAIALAEPALERLLELAGSARDGLRPGAVLPLEVEETLRLVGDRGTVLAENVCGLWPGSDPRLASEVILVTAHYDHVGTRGDEVFNGADDNGSGTSLLLAVSEALATYGPMRRSVMLMWVSGEEKGLWGSQAWVEDPWLPEGMRAVCDINIDMVGRNAPDQLLVTPTRARTEHNGLVRLAESLAPLEGFPELGSADEYYKRSDHYNFAQAGIPSAFLFSDVHADYHRPTDDADKIDYDKVRRVTRLVLRMLDGLQGDRLDL